MPLRFLRNFEWRYSVLLVSIMSLLVISPFLGTGRVQNNVIAVLFLVILIGGIYAISGSRRFLIIAWTLMGLSQVANLVYLFHQGPVLLLFRISLFFLFFGLIGKTILANILRPGTMTADRIFGAICVYLLMGLGWAMAYSTLESFWPGSFRIGEEITMLGPGNEGHQFSVFVYYSFVTISTLGYGDITPVTPPARAFSFLEAVTGQLYLAVLIAGLVGIHISHRFRGGIS